MLKELLTKSRSYRSFDESARIEKAQLVQWVNHTRLAPSSINLQMLKYRIVCDATECEQLLSATRWAGKLKDIKLPPKGHAPTAYIVICADTDVISTAEKFQKDVGICAQTIMLAACEDGFGGCMIGSFSTEEIARILSLPASCVPMLILALGKPDEEIVITDEAPDGSVTYYRENGVHHVQKRKLEHLLID